MKPMSQLHIAASMNKNKSSQRDISGLDNLPEGDANCANRGLIPLKETHIAARRQATLRGTRIELGLIVERSRQTSRLVCSRL